MVEMKAIKRFRLGLTWIKAGLTFKVSENFAQILTESGDAKEVSVKPIGG